MKLQLKSIKFSELMSRETYAFNANLFVDGKKIAYLENGGNGGSTNISAYPGCKDILIKAEAFAKSLPKLDSLNMDLEFFCNLELDAYLREKDAKKLIKDMQKNLFYKDMEGTQYYISWKGHTVTSLLGSLKGRNVLKNKISDIKSKGGIVMNTNLDTLELV